MIYFIPTCTGIEAFGEGATLRDAIGAALWELGVQIQDLESLRGCCLNLIEVLSQIRKDKILNQARGYDPVELLEMNAEARDWKITGNVTPARYPLANGVAQARGVTLVSVLTAWYSNFLDGYNRLSVLIDRQEDAIAAVKAATNFMELQAAMIAVLEQFES